MSDTKEISKYKWRAILSHFVSAKTLDGKHHPCPLCGGKDRFRFDDTGGVGNYFCSHCGAGTGIHLLSQVLDISHSAAWREVEKVIEDCGTQMPKPTADRAARINAVLKACNYVQRNGDVHRYLYSRGLTPDYKKTGLREAKSSGGDTMMVGRFVHGKKMVGLHVTFLSDGKKLERVGDSSKKMFAFENGGLEGSAIRLSQIGSGNKLIVAEGIETAMSMSQLIGVPAWATGSAHLMGRLDVPDQITEVFIAADSDASFTGQAAAYNLAKRLSLQKTPKKVKVFIPAKLGTDWNDELQNGLTFDMLCARLLPE